MGRGLSPVQNEIMQVARRQGFNSRRMTRANARGGMCRWTIRRASFAATKCRSGSNREPFIETTRRAGIAGL